MSLPPPGKAVVGVQRGRWRLPVLFILGSVPWAGGLVWLAGLSWFLTDDAFISFRYVRNLLEGHGLVFNPGEYVEGYSNFLWVLELAAAWGLFGVRPELAAPWLSVACTGATLAVMLWWVVHTPGLRHRSWVAWMALGLVCTSATFAVWTSGGGLETRQFTFFVVLAVVCLLLHGHRRRGLLAASLALAAAALTRPEGPLIAACCFGWFVAQRMVETGRLRPDREMLRSLAYLVVPFVIVVAAHFAFRFAYYGEWLPNTYYAKHVRAWYESGIRYLCVAALETGLYLLVPLACVALRARWKARRDLAYALPLLCIVLHMAYLMRIGGDHFEFRPLDFYWPLLAVPAAVGIVHLGGRIRDCLRPSARGGGGIPVAALVLFLAVLLYATVVQNTYLYRHAKVDNPGDRPLLDIAFGLVLSATPGTGPLFALRHELVPDLARQFVGTKALHHRRFARQRIREWSPYEHVERDVIPDDAVVAMEAIGIPPFYIPALVVVDTYGLTDATVARHPVKTANRYRAIAHDRRPPPGYLDRRGVNFMPHPLVEDGLWALARANYAVRVGPDLWMPFDATDHQWAVDRFSGRELRAASDFDGIRVLANFEDGLDGWQTSGDGTVNSSLLDFSLRLPRIGSSGWGFLTSFHPRKAEAATGTARSPEFIAGPDDHLSLLLGGGGSENMGVRLLADGVEVRVWHGPDGLTLRPIVYPLVEVSGKTLQLELFDHEIEPWGYISLDHVTLVRRAGNDGPRDRP